MTDAALSSILPREMTELKLRPLFLFELAVRPASMIGKTPGVDRRVGEITGGRFEGERLRGKILSGGSDWQSVRTDGAWMLDVRCVMETDDGALIGMTYRGMRHGPKEVLDRIAKGETVNPSLYYMRATPYFETASEKYNFLNMMVAVAYGHRLASGPVYSVFEVVQETMEMNPVLRLVEDVFSGGAEMTLSAEPRMIFVLHGSIAVAGHSFVDGEAWHGDGAATIVAGSCGAACWRFELSPQVRDDLVVANGVASRTKLAAPLDPLPEGALLLRGDSVAFPPGGVAYLHRHQGPGIRCLIEGGIRIDTHGRSTSYGPGGAWFEAGPEPVYAQAAADRPSRFIRVMILSQTLLGKSSIQYVNEEDKAKPKSQSYKIFADMPIARGAHA